VCFYEIVCECERDDAVIFENPLDCGVFVLLCDHFDKFGRDCDFRLADRHCQFELFSGVYGGSAIFVNLADQACLLQFIEIVEHRLLRVSR